MNWAVAVAAFGALLILRKRSPKILSRFMWIINGLLALIGGACFSQTAAGDWVSARFADLFGWVGGWSWIGTSAAIVAGVAAGLTVVVVICDLLDKVADSAAIIGLIVLPLLLVTAAGPLADTGSRVYGGATEMGQSSIGRLLGG